MVPLKRVALLAAVFAVACAHAPGRPAPSSIGEGLASYYGGALRGHLTANGERFDPAAFTAAHRTLAFGTCLRVENLENGRSVRVRINDRGPFIERRIVDLSEAGARALDFVERGVARVKLFPCA